MVGVGQDARWGGFMAMAIGSSVLCGGFITEQVYCRGQECRLKFFMYTAG